jgi:hypothetical protein
MVVVVALMQLFQVSRACSPAATSSGYFETKEWHRLSQKLRQVRWILLKPSRTAINRTQYNAEKLADIDGNLANRYIKADAVNDTDSRYALHTILTGVSRL